MHARTALILATALTVTTVAVAAVGTGGAVSGAARVTARPVTTAARALAVLHTWDLRRSAAWSRADPVALARLYAVGSRTGARDVHDLRRWRRRGLRVVGLHQQVAAVDAQAQTTRSLLL